MSPPTRTGGRRQAARVLLVDDSERLLLLSGRDPQHPEASGWWFTPGGGAEGDETPEEAARREVEEETGLAIGRLGPVVLRRRATFAFDGIDYDQDEVYFLARAPHFEPAGARWTDLERRFLVGYRWWTLDELTSTSETVHPPGLADVLRAALRPPDDA